MNVFEQTSFVNRFGQTINPGQQVIYAGKSYGHTSLVRGVFAGVYTNGSGKKVAAAVNVTYTDRYTKQTKFRVAILPKMNVFKFVE